MSARPGQPAVRNATHAGWSLVVVAVVIVGAVSAGTAFSTVALHPRNGEVVSPAAELANQAPVSGRATEGPPSRLPIDWDQLALGRVKILPSVSAAAAEVSFQVAEVTSLGPPTLVEVSNPATARVSERGLFVRYVGRGGGPVWLVAYTLNPGEPLPPVEEQIAAIVEACDTCRRVAFPDGPPGVVLSQPAAPNSVLWRHGTTEWTVIGPSSSVSTGDVESLAAEVQAQLE